MEYISSKFYKYIVTVYTEKQTKRKKANEPAANRKTVLFTWK